MPKRATCAAVALLVAGCGGGDSGDEDKPARPPSTTAQRGEPTPGELPGRGDSRGAQLVLQSGCLACHRLGAAGNDGPGADLSDIGAKLPASAIARTLVKPTAPMPSFADVPRRDRAAIVKYLASLR